VKKLLMMFSLCTLLLTGCGGSEPAGKLVFCDAGWDSIRFHNAVAKVIAQQGFGLATEDLAGSTQITYTALLRGDADVYMEIWSSNLVTYDEDVKAGKFKVAGINYDDNRQGIYVPRYVVYGDSTRQIAPLAPDLKTVADLARYPQLFKDEEHPEKGRLYGAIPGWAIDEIMFKKYKHYGLDKTFTYFRPGSDAALNASFTTAYEKGLPIAGYNWEPTWLSGKLDLLLLADVPYEAKAYKEGRTAAPSVPVTIGMSTKSWQKYPDFARFLAQYHTSSALTAEALAYIADNKASYEAAAKFFLQKHPELWTKWLPPERVKKVQQALPKS
jgi:glycine betaine/proline transport system substrate-binding protein